MASAMRAANATIAPQPAANESSGEANARIERGESDATEAAVAAAEAPQTDEERRDREREQDDCETVQATLLYRLVADLADESEDRRDEKGEPGVAGTRCGHGSTSFRLGDADAGDELRRAELRHGFRLDLGLGSAVRRALDGFEQVVLGFGDDVVGVGQPRDRVAQLAEIGGDQAVAGHGGAPTMRCTVIANAVHSSRFSCARSGRGG